MKKFFAGLAAVLFVVLLGILGILPPFVIIVVLVAALVEGVRNWLYQRGIIGRYEYENGRHVWRRIDQSPSDP